MNAPKYSEALAVVAVPVVAQEGDSEIVAHTADLMLPLDHQSPDQSNTLQSSVNLFAVLRVQTGQWQLIRLLEPELASPRVSPELATGGARAIEYCLRVDDAKTQ